MTDRIFDRAGTWWDLPAGPANTIADVPGVTVGHRTHRENTARTGVTAIFPHDGDLFRNPVPAGLTVLNGFGKSAGLMQLAELGRIETPILLTNTFGVAACTAALIRRAIAQNPEIGRSRPTVNPLVLECNDGRVSDIQALAVTEAMANDAMAAAEIKFAQGTVGAGTGMRTFGFAGAIGSASRRVALPSGRTHTLGASSFPISDGRAISGFWETALRLRSRVGPIRRTGAPSSSSMAPMRHSIHVSLPASRGGRVRRWVGLEAIGATRAAMWLWPFPLPTCFPSTARSRMSSGWPRRSSIRFSLPPWRRRKRRC